MASSAEPPAKRAKLDEQELQKALEEAQEKYNATEAKLEAAYSETPQNDGRIDFLKNALQRCSQDMTWAQQMLLNLTSQKPEVSSTGIQEILSKMNELKHGFLGSEINIDGRIPDELVGAGDTVPSLKASLVGQDVNLTRFLRDQVIKNINEEWTPFELPAEAGEDIRTAHDLKLVVEKAGLGYMRVENDNQFNRKVNIKDSFGRRCYFVSRIDGLIVANPILANSQADSIENIMKQAIAFVEIESGEKGMENAEIQLLSSMMAIAASIQKNFLYGVVINKTFDKARLVKFYLECCCADGCFHPAVLGTVGVQLMTKHP